MVEPAQDDLQSAFLKVALVGPTHPGAGTAGAHTITLAHSLQQAGHDVTLVSWSHPAPGAPSRPDGDHPPGGAPFPRTVRTLSWSRPDTWLRTGRRLRGFDAVLLVHDGVTAVPAQLAVLRAAGCAGPSGATTGAAPRSVVICHGDPRRRPPLGPDLRGVLLRRVDAVLVHTVQDAETVHGLGANRVTVADLPAGDAEGPGAAVEHHGPARLLALGRRHDDGGIDELLEALRDVPDLHLTIAGELADEQGRRIRRLAADPALAQRVVIHDADLPADALAALVAQHDVLTLTGTTSRPSQAAGRVVLGQIHGLTVLTSDVGQLPLPDAARRGGAGTLSVLDRGAVDADLDLAGALRRLCDPVLLAELREGPQVPDLSTPWASYIGALESLATPDPGGLTTSGDEDPSPAAPTPSLVQRAQTAARTAVTRHRRVVPLTRTDLPDWVLPTDVLGDAADADDAKRTARQLGLPRVGDATAAWAALGALAAIVRVSDDGQHSAIVVDESGARSVLSRWARSVGFAPVELGLTRPRASVAALEVDAGALDVIARLHPGGCDAADVDETVAEASWALRPGGLLILTLPLGPAGLEGAMGPAEVRAVVARADSLGFVLVGDLDRDIGARMMAASAGSTSTDTVYGLVRLTLRRR